MTADIDFWWDWAVRFKEENIRAGGMYIVEVKYADSNHKTGKGPFDWAEKKTGERNTDVLSSTLDVNPEWVSVLIEEFDRQNWAT